MQDFITVSIWRMCVTKLFYILKHVKIVLKSRGKDKNDNNNNNNNNNNSNNNNNNNNSDINMRQKYSKK